MNAITIAAAERFYRRACPLHGRSKVFKEDIDTIGKASQPMSMAERLVTQRLAEITEAKIETMLRDQQGRRKRYLYNQRAVIGIEHILNGPMDPTTQLPIWREMLAMTKGSTIPKDDFMRMARAILCQVNLYDPETMAP